jgi:excinuclease ABC subunit A
MSEQEPTPAPLPPSAADAAPAAAKRAKPAIELIGVRQNNLKGFNLSLPRGKFTVVTGPSGSGKSTLAFDTLYAEGQRRYVESLSTYVRQFLERMPRPDVDIVRNIPPAIALEQRNTSRSSRSTVATATEIYDYLRLLFATIGVTHCDKCGKPVAPGDPSRAAAALVAAHPAARAVIAFAAFEPPVKPALRKQRLAALQAAGFTRGWHKGAPRPLAEWETAKTIPADLEVAADRVTLDEGGRGRLAEALDTSLEQGRGFATVELEGGRRVVITNRFACADCRTAYEPPVPKLFSFNNPFGACPECKGFGNILELNRRLIVPDTSLSLAGGAIEPFTKPSYEPWMTAMLEKAAAHGIDISVPFEKLPPEHVEFLFAGGPGFPGIHGYFARLEAKKYKLHVRVFVSRYKSERPCQGCGGGRLNQAARRVRVNDLGIDKVTHLTFHDFQAFLADVRALAGGNAAAERILDELVKRSGYALEVGLAYLTLDRLMRTLSGGEAQRIALANQLGSGLTDTLYVLDEPTIGLHPHNTERLLHVLRDLVARGNTLVVVEHDTEVIKQADSIVELGPESGLRGGELVYAGDGGAAYKKSGTLTARYLTGQAGIPVPAARRKAVRGELTIIGAREHNLKHVDFSVPLGTFTCVTGVSGSGKSTLVHQTLYGALARVFGIEYEGLGEFEAIHGLNLVRGAVLIDQQPIGKTARSIPASYIGIYDDVRRCLAQSEDARLRGYKPGHFSFNVPGGRCERCGGMGTETVEMHFLSDLEIECEECAGTRFTKGVLGVLYRGRNVAQILGLTVDEAVKFFAQERKIVDRLRLLSEVGLGYVTLGQSARTLSGGESQRLKIAGELGVRRERTLYILDEPTTGLHLSEVALLIKVLNRLVDQGNTVLVIEHNLDVIKSADHVIDMGPGGGEMGGHIIAAGTPEELARSRKSITGRYLRDVLR